MQQDFGVKMDCDLIDLTSQPREASCNAAGQTLPRFGENFTEEKLVSHSVPDLTPFDGTGGGALSRSKKPRSLFPGFTRSCGQLPSALGKVGGRAVAIWMSPR